MQWDADTSIKDKVSSAKVVRCLLLMGYTRESDKVCRILCAWAPPAFLEGGGGGGGGRIGQGGRHLTAVNTLSAFGRFNERGGGRVSAFGRFNERGGGAMAPPPLGTPLVCVGI